jgi:phosphoribosylformylglycinamidine synthase
VLRIKHTRQAVAVSLDCNGRFVYLEPHRGGALAVAEAARNVAITGAQPIGMTNCLNFGNPMDPEVFYQFKQAVTGMAQACRALDLPVTGGNVSFYNESPEGAIDPTPVVGVVGLLPDADKLVTPWFKNPGDVIFLLGETKDEMGGSAWLYELQDIKAGEPPALNLKKEAALQALLVEAAAQGCLSSAQDCAEGGLGVALAEATFLAKTHCGALMGAEVNITTGLAPTTLLFSETASRVLVSASPAQAEKFKALCRRHRVYCQEIGRVGGNTLAVFANSLPVMEVAVGKLYAAWKGGLQHYV